MVVGLEPIDQSVKGVAVVKEAAWSAVKLHGFHALWICAIVLFSIHITVAYISPSWPFFPDGSWPFVWGELFRWLVVPFVAMLGFCQLRHSEVKLSDFNQVGKIRQLLLDKLRRSYPAVEWDNVVLKQYTVVELDADEAGD
ncbi:MAG: hypothetical protein Aurels2KO_16700 [Aureliella sp.]